MLHTIPASCSRSGSRRWRTGCLGRCGRAVPAAGFLPVSGHVQSRQNQAAFQCLAHRPTDNAPREQIENDRQIQPSLAGPDIGDVCRPAGIGRFGTENRGRAGSRRSADHGRCRWSRQSAWDARRGSRERRIRRAIRFSLTSDARFFEFGVDARTAVGLLALLMGGLDLLGQRVRFDLALHSWRRLRQA